MSESRLYLKTNALFILAITLSFFFGNRLDGQEKFQPNFRRIINEIRINHTRESTVYWSETFDNGINGWTFSNENKNEENFIWSADGVFKSAKGENLSFYTNENSTGAMGFPAGWFQTGKTGDTDVIPASASEYEEYSASLISPIIDLSSVVENVSVKFDQYARRLNPFSYKTPIFSINWSIDGGETWSDPIEINSNFELHLAYQSTVEIPIPQLSEESNVKIKFNWKGDFYFWIIDNVKITGLEKSFNLQDSLALVEFYNSTNGSNWFNHENWLVAGQSIDTWYGVTTNGERVTGILLPENNLEGTIPENIGQMSELKWLNLSKNSLSGELPKSLQLASQLREINLDQNKLSGNIPLEWGSLTYLQILNVSQNDLSGVLTSGLGNCINMKKINISSNNFIGEIPASFSNLANLYKFNISSNKFTSIPKSLWEMDIELFFASNNLLEGEIPVEIEQNKKLRHLLLKNNLFSGEIPNVFHKMENLQNVDLSFNHFTGSLPDSLPNGGDLRVDFSNNNLSGCYPLSYYDYCNAINVKFSNNPDLPNNGYLILFCSNGSGACSSFNGSNEEDSLALVAFYNTMNGSNWKNKDNWLVAGMPISEWNGVDIDEDGRVVSLKLSDNNVAGIIPAVIGNLQMLQFLDLSKNNVSGELPIEIWTLTHLKQLKLFQNNIEGELISEISNLHELEILSISDNKLNGSVPDIFRSVKKLKSLILSNNQILGDIPSSIGVLRELEYLELDKNNFTGSIPVSFGNLTLLKKLILNDNELTGSLPLELTNCVSLESCDLRNNKLLGCFPFEYHGFCNIDFNVTGNLELANNGDFEAFCNNYEGVCGSINKNDSLALADFYNSTGGPNWTNSENWLVPNVPLDRWYGVKLNSSGRVKYISLRDNNLVGTIPTTIESLEKLETLNLESNNLTGNLLVELTKMKWLKIIRLRYNNLSGCIPIEYNKFCEDGYYVKLDGNPNLPDNGDLETFCNDLSGVCGNTIVGRIIFDKNKNCLEDSDEPTLLSQWKVKASNDEVETYGFLNPLGFYGIKLDGGNYTLEASVENDLWGGDCIKKEITVDTSSQTVNLFAESNDDCADLNVEIAIQSLMRRCFKNRYLVQYCNNGTIDAENAYVEISLDDKIELDSTSIPYVQNGNLYTFELGNIAVNTCSEFYLDVTISCEADLTQTLCANATIYPNSDCNNFSPDWSGASLRVSGECTGDEVKFKIENIGDGDMKEPGSYIIIEDQVVLVARPDVLLLKSGEVKEMSYPANGSTYILKTDQVLHHPGNSHPLVAIEGCGINDDGTYSKGFVTQYSEDDEDSFVSIDCQEVRGSWDPNDKIGYPIGYGTEHLIDTGQIIDYRIRFQNTGTDTAFKVVVKDVISPFLDLSSISMGVSNYPYTTEFLGDTLVITFDPIELPDSNINEVASHGFVKFKIGQQSNLPIGTVIENTANIYFDFNEAVVTNTTTHKIGKEYYEIVNVEEPLIDGLKVEVSPNPFRDETILSLRGIDFKRAELKLYNMNGILLRTEQFDGTQLIISGNGLVSGVYYFKLQVDGKLAMNGKLIMQ